MTLVFSSRQDDTPIFKGAPCSYWAWFPRGMTQRVDDLSGQILRIMPAVPVKMGQQVKEIASGER